MGVSGKTVIGVIVAIFIVALFTWLVVSLTKDNFYSGYYSDEKREQILRSQRHQPLHIVDDKFIMEPGSCRQYQKDNDQLNVLDIDKDELNVEPKNEPEPTDAEVVTKLVDQELNGVV